MYDLGRTHTDEHMDQNELSRRLRLLAGGDVSALPQRCEGHSFILGSLGFACAVRRAQAILLMLALIVASSLAIQASGIQSQSGTWGLALFLVGVSMVIVRFFPYRTPQMALKRGLLALSQHQLNDPAAFIAHQRTRLDAVNNTLLSDLCLQLAMDRRRPNQRNPSK